MWYACTVHACVIVWACIKHASLCVLRHKIVLCGSWKPCVTKKHNFFCGNFPRVGNIPMSNLRCVYLN